MAKIVNPFTGKEIRGNPWARQSCNLTEQGIIQKTDPTLAERLQKEAVELDAAESRRAHTRSLAEFNKLDQTGKIRFIQNGGIVE